MNKYPLTLIMTGFVLCAVAAITPLAAGDPDPPVVLQTPVCCVEGGLVIFTYVDPDGDTVPVTPAYCVDVAEGLYWVGDYRPTDAESPCLDLPGCHD